MNRLPEELYRMIAGYVSCFNGPGLTTLAAVSRRWQMTVEQQLFRKLEIKSSDLKDLDLIVRGHRPQLVAKINFTIILPTYGEAARQWLEGEKDRQLNDEAFTVAMTHLFRVLEDWKECRPGSLTIDLLEPESPTDTRIYQFLSPASQNSNEGDEDDDLSGDEDLPRDIGAYRYRFSRLTLLRPDKLPWLPCVGSINYIPGLETRLISGESIVHILSRLPALNCFRWRMDDNELRYPALRRKERQDMADALRQCSLAPTVTCLDFSMTSSLCKDVRFVPSRISSPRLGEDPLCSALKDTLARLEELTDLTLEGVFDESLLLGALKPGAREALFRNLQVFNLAFSMERPQGGWYFRPSISVPAFTPVPVTTEDSFPPGYDQTHEEIVEASKRFSSLDNDRLGRTGKPISDLIPDEETIVPLLKAFANVCNQLSSLRKASIDTGLPGPRISGMSLSRPWGVWYFAPGERPGAVQSDFDPVFYEYSTHRRLFWEVPGWVPEDSLREGFQSIGRDRHGSMLVERFMDSWVQVLEDYKKHRLPIFDDSNESSGSAAA